MAIGSRHCIYGLKAYAADQPWRNAAMNCAEFSLDQRFGRLWPPFFVICTLSLRNAVRERPPEIEVDAADGLMPMDNDGIEEHGGFKPAVRENPPAFNVPGAVLFLIIVFALVHLYRANLGFMDDFRVLTEDGFTPSRLALALGWRDQTEILKSIMQLPDAARPATAFLQAGLDAGSGVWSSLVSYAFLHGDLAHVTLNSLWFLAFGSVVARRLGTMLFLLFFAVTAALSALAYAALNMDSVIPLIGASGAISAAMGASMLLPFQSRRFGPPQPAEAAPLMPLLQAIGSRRVVFMTLSWVFINLLFGLGINLGGDGQEAANVAWEAHIAGFIVGFLLLPLFDRFRHRAAPMI
jgi:membrane associated rhomboid family serine protease